MKPTQFINLNIAGGQVVPPSSQSNTGAGAEARLRLGEGVPSTLKYGEPSPSTGMCKFKFATEI